MLRPCPTCLRHARADHRTCPFCGAALGAAPRDPEARAFARLARAATIGVALGVAACAESTPASKDPSVELPEAGPIATATATATASATATTSTAVHPPPPPPDDWRQHRRAQCTPEGQCPPYGGAPAELEVV